MVKRRYCSHLAMAFSAALLASTPPAHAASPGKPIAEQVACLGQQGQQCRPVRADKTLQEVVQALQDEMQIRRVIALYGQLLDDRRFDEWADLFLNDAVVMGHAGRQAFLKGIAGIQPSTPTKHLACTSVIDLEGDHATAWTDGLALVDIGDGPNGSRLYATYPLRYYDKFVRVDGRWRIARRESALPGAHLPLTAQKTPAW